MQDNEIVYECSGKNIVMRWNEDMKIILPLHEWKRSLFVF
jgi:hypothetical protein